MMKRTYVIIIILLLGCLLCIDEKIYAMESLGFATEEMPVDEIELFLNNVNISPFFAEPSKESIKCFDVNKNGMIAIGTEKGSDKRVCIYSDTGIFQYGYRFQTDGSFGVEFDGEVLKIYFVRSDVSVSINPVGEVQDVSRICETSENNTYWNQYVRATSRTVGEYQYILKNDIGILGMFASSYSQLYQVDRVDNEKLIYDANSFQFYDMLIKFVGIIVFVSMVAVAIIKEFKKLQKEGMKR